MEDVTTDSSGETGDSEGSDVNTVAVGGEGTGGTDQTTDSSNTGTDDSVVDGAPDAYVDFTMPEGMEADTGLMDKFKDVAKELNLNQEAAQKLIDLQTANMANQNTAREGEAKEVIQKWEKELREDPDFGGDKYDENRSIVHKAVREFGGEDLSKIEAVLNKTGLGSYPPFVKMLLAVGNGMGEDNFKPGTNITTEKTTAETLYGKDGKSG